MIRLSPSIVAVALVVGGATGCAWHGTSEWPDVNHFSDINDPDC